MQALYKGAVRPGIIPPDEVDLASLTLASGAPASASTNVETADEGIQASPRLASLSSLQQVPIGTDTNMHASCFSFPEHAANAFCNTDENDEANSNAMQTAAGRADVLKSQQSRPHRVLDKQREANAAARARARSNLFSRHAAPALTCTSDTAPPVNTMQPVATGASQRASFDGAAAEPVAQRNSPAEQATGASALEDLLRESNAGAKPQASLQQVPIGGAVEQQDGLQRVAGGGSGLVGASINGSISAASATHGPSRVAAQGAVGGGFQRTAGGMAVVHATRSATSPCIMSITAIFDKHVCASCTIPYRQCMLCDEDEHCRSGQPAKSAAATEHARNAPASLRLPAAMHARLQDKVCGPCKSWRLSQMMRLSRQMILQAVDVLVVQARHRLSSKLMVDQSMPGAQAKASYIPPST